jgi:hypothetical protein
MVVQEESLAAKQASSPQQLMRDTAICPQAGGILVRLA